MQAAVRACAAALVLCLPFASSALAGPADEAQIRALLDRWAKAFHDRDVAGVMSMYPRTGDLVAFDIVPPLRYVGYEAYKKDYETFLAGYKGPVEVEYRDLKIEVSGTLGFAYGLERLSGTLVNGQPSSMWIRFTSGFRKIGGRWYDVHDHISVPTDFETGKAALELTP